jgi:hypothetical protein
MGTSTRRSGTSALLCALLIGQASAACAAEPDRQLVASPDWIYAPNGELCAATNVHVPQMVQFALRYDPATRRETWLVGVALQNSEFGGAHPTDRFTVELHLLESGRAIGMAKGVLLKSTSYDRPALYPFAEWFPLSSFLANASVINIHYRAKVDGGTVMLDTRTTVEPQAMKAVVAKLRACSYAPALTAAWSRVQAGTVRVRIAGQSYVPATTVIAPCATVFTLPGGRKIRVNHDGDHATLVTGTGRPYLEFSGTSVQVRPVTESPAASDAAIAGLLHPYEDWLRGC